MKIDPNFLRSLADRDDAALTRTVQSIAAASGLDLAGVQFEKSKLDALRIALRGATDADLEKAKSILTGYKKL